MDRILLLQPIIIYRRPYMQTVANYSRLLQASSWGSGVLLWKLL